MSTFQERVAEAKLKRQQEAAAQRDKLAAQKQQECEKLAEQGEAARSSTSSWLSTFDKKRVMLEKRLADREHQVELEAEKKRNAGYHLEDVEGLRVMHDAADIKEGQELILTLDDMDVLDMNTEQRLVSRKLVDQEKQKKLDDFKRDEHKPVYNAYDDDAAMLSQYDEEKKQSFMLSGGGLDPEAQQRLQKLREAAALEAKRLQEADSAGPSRLQVASDYLTVEEMRAFRKPNSKNKKKKKKKKSKRRRKTTSALLEGLEEEQQEEDAEPVVGDLGHRDHEAAERAQHEQKKRRLLAKQQRYEMALQGALKASKRHLGAPTGQQQQPEEEEVDEEERELQRTLAAARRRKQSAAPSKQSAAEQIAARAAKRQQQQQQQQEQQGEVYTRSFGVPEPQEEEGEERPETRTVKVEREEHQEPEAHVGFEEEGEVIEAESVPKFSGGMASTLAALQIHGVKEEDAVGAREGERDAEQVSWNLDKRDEFGRLMTPKEAFKDQARAFHGKFPGAMKQEKRLRQYQREIRAKEKLTLAHTLKSTEKIERKQKQTGLAYVKLTLGSVDVLEMQEQAKAAIAKETQNKKRKKK